MLSPSYVACYKYIKFLLFDDIYVKRSFRFEIKLFNSVILFDKIALK